MSTSTATNNRLVKIETYSSDSRVAILRMAAPPVNVLSTDMILAILDAIRSIENNPQYKVLVLTSGLLGVFTAGLDIREMYNTTREKHRHFWTSLQQLFSALYISPLITIALINGECPAAGCLLATACDHRLMQSAYRIGLNETRLGISAPWWFIVPFKNLIGHRQTEKHLQLGTLLRAEDALSLGLVDSVADTQEQLFEQVDQIVHEWVKVPAQARAQTKLALRQDLVQKLQKEAEQDWEQTWAFVSSDAVQSMLRHYLSSLAKSRGQRSKL